MIRKNLPIAACAFCVVLLTACGTGPKPVPTGATGTSPTSISPNPSGTQPPPVNPPPVFDPANVSVEKKQTTFTDIRGFIEGLNRIIQRKDFNTWKSHLTVEFIAYYSDPTVLAQLSESPVLKRMGIKLATLQDYFTFAVYPAHQNDRIDDIEFVSEILVKAITIGTKGDRQILYNLEKTGDTWKIGIGR